MLEFSRLNVFTETTLTSNIEVSHKKTKNKNAKQQKNKDTHEGRRLVVSSLTTSLESSKFRRMSSSCICSKPKICSATGNCICDTSLNFQARGQGCQCPEVWGYTTSEDGLSCVWSGSTVALLVLCCMLWLATGWIGALYAKFCYREVVFEHTLVKNTLRQSRSHTNVRSSDTKKKSIFSPTWKKRVRKNHFHETRNIESKTNDFVSEILRNTFECGRC